jgi:ankyrin repeat protein
LGATALTGAASRGHYDVVKILIDAGADVNAKPSKKAERGETALIKAVLGGYSDVVKLLLENSAEVNATETNGNGETALMKASFYGNIEMMKILLAAGADTNIKNNDGDTALEMAQSVKGREDVVKLLKTHGATE